MSFKACGVIAKPQPDTTLATASGVEPISAGALFMAK